MVSYCLRNVNLIIALEHVSQSVYRKQEFLELIYILWFPKERFLNIS